MFDGDVDWIAMKALEKDRTRRYETANAFGADVLRYLNDEPVEASPPSTAYRLRKFARKYRKPVIALWPSRPCFYSASPAQPGACSARRKLSNWRGPPKTRPSDPKGKPFSP